MDRSEKENNAIHCAIALKKPVFIEHRILLKPI
jgi:hypothetical protein